MKICRAAGNIFTLSIFAVTFFTFFVGKLFAQDKLVISAIEGSIKDNTGLLVIKEAYKKIGIDIEIRTYNPTEGIKFANMGNLDGELQRIDGINQKYTNLVQVQIPINYLEACAFSKNKNLKVDGWSSLKSLRIGLVKGIKFAEQGTKGMNVKVFDNYDDLIYMLQQDEVDVAIMSRITGIVILNEKGITEISGIHGNIESIFLYHYLHKKHSALVPLLEDVLKGMFKEGIIRKTKERLLKKYKNN